MKLLTSLPLRRRRTKLVRANTTIEHEDALVVLAEARASHRTYAGQLRLIIATWAEKNRR